MISLIRFYALLKMSSPVLIFFRFARLVPRMVIIAFSRYCAKCYGACIFSDRIRRCMHILFEREFERHRGEILKHAFTTVLNAHGGSSI